MNEKDYLLWLSSVEGVGSKTIEKLIFLFGSAENVFNTSMEQLNRIKGINTKTIGNIVKDRNNEYILNLKTSLRKNSIDLLAKIEDIYPKNLKEIYDPPYLLYKKGNIGDIDNNAVAIVGSRKASPYGKWAAYKFAKELAMQGVTIVSGMAYGIDSASHKGAVECGGKTIAVLGCGVDICYPKSNLNLMRNIEKSGAIISEYPVGVEPLPGNFPARNRIISGLVKGVIIVEAAEKSGSLITAEFALDQGREVFAVPGNINSPLSKGTNKLIKEGAKPVTCVEDVLEELDLEIEKKENKDIELSHMERAIYDFVMKRQPIPFDILIKEFQMNINELSGIITILELKGLIEQLPGKIIIIK